MSRTRLSRISIGRTSPSTWRSSGTWATPARIDWRGVAVVSSCPPRRIDPDVDSIVVAQAGDGLGELGLAVSLHAGEGDDLAGADLEVDMVDHGQPALVDDGEILDLEDGLSRRGRLLAHHELDRRPDHHRGQLLLARLGRRRRADHLAEAHHGDAVGDGEHLLQLVGDEQDRAARRPRATA